MSPPSVVRARRGKKKWARKQKPSGAKDLELQKELRKSGQVLLYAVLCGDCLKIGVTTRILKRMQQFRHANPMPIKLLGTVRCRQQMEWKLHQLLKDDRIHGEWFKSSDLVLLVAALISAGDFAQLESLANSPGIKAA